MHRTAKCIGAGDLPRQAGVLQGTWAFVTRRFLERFREAAESSKRVDLEALVGTSPEEVQVIEIVRAIRCGTPRLFFVNLPNRGQIPNLPAGAVVEGPALALRCLTADPGCTGLSKAQAILGGLLRTNGRHVKSFR